MTPSVRAATAADLDDVVRVFLACWRTSYAETLPARLVASMTDERARALWRRAAESARPGELLVAVDDGVTVGVTRSAATGSGEGAVHSLYVHPDAQGRGAGARLLAEAVRRLGERGVRVARLWVFRDNTPSRRFYASQGWAADGAERVQDEFGEPELQLTRPVPGPAAHPAVTGAVERILEPGPTWTPPGGAVVMVRTSAGTYAHAAGDRLTGAPMTVATVHDLASVTKLVTTAMCLRLVSSGRLGLDDDVRAHLPSFAHAVTVRQLLLHRAGLWEWWPFYVRAAHAEAAYAELDTLPLRYPPDTGRHYSDLGFMLLGRIVAAVTGGGLRAAVRDLVAEPLGLPTLGYGPRTDDELAAGADGDAVERRMLATSTPYPVPFGLGDMDRWRDGLVVGTAADGNAFHALDGVSGHAGLFASAPDLLAFAAAAAGTDPALLAEGPDAGQALGWRTDTLRAGPDTVELRYHPGYTGTTVAMVPGHAIAFVVATNRLVTPGEPATNDHLRQVTAAAVEDLLYAPVTTPTRYP
ncbi:GNAT family N-acetyltransferase [Jiangella mangrovi]|uniref:CubicO group peptidase (Beta-lactamase class C family) n=1 Tax=Jiangella mangrovi TaxID=1524084 RepID=A0A7W9LJP4_9ACTN|nr:GNAT family N-acetyltransferase [Jiangella mangrovi]MBB5786239.1 CubicO group peptidase (beta-lactamase class C family) [Jiangella mangrovi]